MTPRVSPNEVERRRNPRERRKAAHRITPGTATVYLIVVVLGTIGFKKAGDLTDRVARQAQTTCELQQASSRATLDLGLIIEAARAQTPTDPATQVAVADYLDLVAKLPPSPTTRALRDLSVLVRNQPTAPAPHDSGPQKAVPVKLDPRELARREDEFIRLTHTLKKPRNCGKAFS